MSDWRAWDPNERVPKIENHDFVRFRVVMQGNQRTFESAVVQSISLDYNKIDLPPIVGN